MKIRLIKRWNGFKTNCVRDVTEGVANLLVRKGVAEIIREESAVEEAVLSGASERAVMRRNKGR